jgi:hypothetical protein
MPGFGGGYVRLHCVGDYDPRFQELPQYAGSLNSNDDAVLTHAKLRRDPSDDDIRGILPSDCQLSPSELAAVLDLVRNPPTLPAPRK